MVDKEEPESETGVFSLGSYILFTLLVLITLIYSALT